MKYAELHCWSNFTFLEGGSHPEELVEAAARLGLSALALTDRDGLYGTVRFSKAAKNCGLPAICGAELTFALPAATRVVLLAEDAAGYANLVELISLAQMRGSKGDPRLQLEDFEGRTAGLVALSGGWNGIAESHSAALAALFGSGFFLEMQHHLRAEDAALVRATLALAKRLGVAYVATNGVAYACKEDAYLADVLSCVKKKTNLADAHARKLLRPNTEYALKTPAMMAKLFAPYPQALKNTLAIAERCTFRLDRLAGQFPLFPVPPGESSRQSYLRTLVYRGAAGRYGTPLPSDVERQLEYELGIIARLDLAGYFLIVWDIVRAATELGVLCQGRGSAANSAVCYALGITAVDPVGGKLLFERFLTEDRQEVPDIDIDFAHEDREKVIQYVYERYGRAHAAMAAEVITYRTRSAIRDVGKALGLTLAQVDAVAREFDARESLAEAMGVDDAPRGALPPSIESRRDLDASTMTYASRIENGASYVPRFEAQDLPPCHPEERAAGAPRRAAAVDGIIAERLFALCRRVDGFPRHMGIHSGGMVITRDPLIRVAPVEWATMRDRTIVQWDKDDLNDLGLIKIDLLGLGMLSLLREAFALYARCEREESLPPAAPRHAPLALYTIPADDKPSYAMMQRADTIGVFQIESRAQQSMLPRMK
ncbi:MAG: PHP domain-containing protein, partial [Candidatus Eremiobacteraeota bacterium]|nr:PHP domain-containing protein [Candidatus Eremiobacteraeota bacterium]